MPKITFCPNCLVGLLIFLNSFVLAQPTRLPMDSTILAAYQNKSRAYTGEPGPTYFVNSSDYQIQATFDPSTRILNGTETIVYHNHSADTLQELVLRLYQDRLRKDFKGDYRLSEKILTDGVEIEHILINQDTLALYLDSSPVRRSGTNMFIDLASPLLPRSTVELSIAWSFTLPNGVANRYGSYGEHSFFIAYWYPQMAVYDDVFGWDVFDHTGLQEFYNDIGNFEVEITVPDSFLVWSTGVFLNPEQILTPTYLERYQQAMTIDSVIKIVSEEDYKQGRAITQAKDQHTWTYKATGVPDFAFAVTKDYYWDATSAVVDQEGTRVLVDACYKPESQDFYHVAGFGKEAIEDLSLKQPGIPYPYPKMTIFNGESGGGGMEFPMIVNDGSSFSLGSAFSLTYHEIAHTYFPFFMGINERRFAWMDEGWASFLPVDLMKKRGFADSPMSENVTGMIGFSRFSPLKPLMTPSIELKGMPYYVYAYYHPATAYYVLRDMLGEEVFKEALQTYMKRWAGKHPLPYDFFFTFNEVAGKSLDWYWKAWFFEGGKPDLTLDIIKVKKKKAQLKVLLKGSMPVPIHLKVSFADGTEEVLYYTAAIWEDGRTEWEFNRKFAKPIIGIRLGASDIPDANARDNFFKFEKKTK